VTSPAGLRFAASVAEAAALALSDTGEVVIDGATWKITLGVGSPGGGYGLALLCVDSGGGHAPAERRCLVLRASSGRRG
jgi:hypothetical protein